MKSDQLFAFLGVMIVVASAAVMVTFICVVMP